MHSGQHGGEGQQGVGQPKCLITNLGRGEASRGEDWPQIAGWSMVLSEQEGRDRSAAGTWLVGLALGIGEGFWPLPWHCACGLQDKVHQRLKESGNTSG